MFLYLWLNGYDLKALPLTIEKILKDVLPNENTIRLSEVLKLLPLIF
jgi:hypothetical protein